MADDRVEPEVWRRKITALDATLCDMLDFLEESPVPAGDDRIDALILETRAILKNVFKALSARRPGLVDELYQSFRESDGLNGE